MYIRIKDVTFLSNALVAFGVLTVPATLQTPEYFAITVWLANVKDPITVTYASEEERDMYCEIISDSIKDL